MVWILTQCTFIKNSNKIGEKIYAAYDGLNLTWEVLDGIVKKPHNGPVINNIPTYLTEYNLQK